MGYIFERDVDGVGEVLKVMCADVIREIALKVGESADNGAKASEFSQVGDYVGKRRFTATISVPAYRQATDGVLTRAASEQGLEVHLDEPLPVRTNRRKKK